MKFVLNIEKILSKENRRQKTAAFPLAIFFSDGSESLFYYITEFIHGKKIFSCLEVF